MRLSPKEWERLFGPPRRRSWPWPPTKLERLAEAMGVGDEELRSLLRGAIQARLRERGAAWKSLDSTLEERERRRNGA